MSATVLACGNVFDGSSEELSGPAEIPVEGNWIASIGRSVNRPRGPQVIDLSDRTVTPDLLTPRPPDQGCGKSGAADARIFSQQGAQGAKPRPRVHELRLHDLARPRQCRSGMADR
jgi:hypothetical protein